MAPKRRAALKEPTARRSKRGKPNEPVSATTLITQPTSADAACSAVFGTIDPSRTSSRTETAEISSWLSGVDDAAATHVGALLHTGGVLDSALPVLHTGVQGPPYAFVPVRPGLQDLEFVPASQKKNVADAIKDLTSVILCPLAKVAGSDNPAVFGLQDRDESCKIDLTQLQKHPGSWRQMLLTDRPCKSVTFEATLNFESSGDETDPSLRLRFEGDAQDSDGVKLGTLVDAMLATKKKGGSTCELTNGTLKSNKGKKRSGELDVSAQDLEKYRVHGDSIQSFSACVSLSRMVVPTQSEWDQVRRLARMV